MMWVVCVCVFVCEGVDVCVGSTLLALINLYSPDSGGGRGARCREIPELRVQLLHLVYNNL